MNRQPFFSDQGRRRLFKSGTAMERRVAKARVGEEHERGDSREKIFEFKMSLEAVLMHFETILSCEIQSIL